MTYIKPIIVALALISMTACSGSKKEQPKLDYQSQSHRLVKLEVPPDFEQPRPRQPLPITGRQRRRPRQRLQQTPHPSRTTTCQCRSFEIR